jgi:ubiquinone biosynthesis protein UbiJ
MVADSICDNCLAETRTSITRSEIIKDFEEVEKVREQMEEITKELEELMRKLGQ